MFMAPVNGNLSLTDWDKLKTKIQVGTLVLRSI
jgi:hypothetical protein